MFNTRKVNSHTSPKHPSPVSHRATQSHTEPVKDEGVSQSQHHNSGDVGKSERGREEKGNKGETLSSKTPNSYSIKSTSSDVLLTQNKLRKLGSQKKG